MMQAWAVPGQAQTARTCSDSQAVDGDVHRIPSRNAAVAFGQLRRILSLCRKTSSDPWNEVAQ